METSRSIPTTPPRPWKELSTVCFLTIVVPSLITFFHSGKSAMEKLITGMCQPLFVLLILSMSIGLYLARRCERTIGLGLLVSSSIVWVLSTPVFVGYLFTLWESPVIPNELSEPLDYIVVLGGGTNTAPFGRPQFGEAGDRVAYAAHLYVEGKAKHLVTTGDVLETSSLITKPGIEHDPSNQTRRLLVGLGIPDQVIFEIAGENTSREMESLAKHPEWWKEKKCGLITSAFHMPRALRLAEQKGVQVVGLPADYRSGHGPFMINDLFPVARELHRFQMLLKECLAFMVGR